MHSIGLGIFILTTFADFLLFTTNYTTIKERETEIWSTVKTNFLLRHPDEMRDCMQTLLTVSYLPKRQRKANSALSKASLPYLLPEVGSQ